MDAFQYNKYNEREFVKQLIADSVIIAYGFITAIDFDNVTVTLAVSDRGTAERVRCTFMNIGSELFSLSMKPVEGMRVLVMSPNKAAEGMYESYTQLNLNQGRDYILTGSPAIYSSQFAFCIPVMKSTTQAISSLIIDSSALTAEVKQELLITLFSTVEVDLKGDTNIEFHEDTEHFRGWYGNLSETFGMIEGIGGTEKEGDYEYEETYGKFSSVKKNYESGFTAVIGKAYEKPFLVDKGALIDSSAPVTLTFGKEAPAVLTASAPITVNMGAGVPVTLNFGDSVVTVAVDSSTGLNITLSGSAPVQIVADAGMVKLGNTAGTLKAVLDQIADLFTNMTTIGPNVVPGAPYTAAATPATALAATNLKALIDSIFN